MLSVAAPALFIVHYSLFTRRKSITNCRCTSWKRRSVSPGVDPCAPCCYSPPTCIVPAVSRLFPPAGVTGKCPMTRKSVLLACAIVVFLFGGTGTALVLLAWHEPAFYVRASLP